VSSFVVVKAENFICILRMVFVLFVLEIVCYIDFENFVISLLSMDIIACGMHLFKGPLNGCVCMHLFINIVSKYQLCQESMLVLTFSTGMVWLN